MFYWISRILFYLLNLFNCFMFIFSCILKILLMDWFFISIGPLSCIYSKYDNSYIWWYKQLTLKLSCSVIHFNFSWWTFQATSGISKQHLHPLACPWWHNCYSCTCVRGITKFQLSYIDGMDKIFIMYYPT